ncbi:aminodeoxychorismate synthase, subunit I [Peptoclostridium litorale DSM 5388]|uniref:aminodeoxychorismate synthase n=1 Tax=Peptoclostridium litorale DSM 5388 TaxID=1121324 RepID=A0A069RQX6_PEPLI|nr:aminodeoxychorismate synthase component I [Peptoclostridium litorale]KDR96582.1 aminodeoxychorismate synthase component 1 [Peptoclostridium litorale DSM 5388]SIN68848.1 aminodeoxychorismate synthase, subunit I [Peptoclostridium litorale DSM 5388]
MIIKKIYTSLSSFEIFSLFRERKYCFFLDSAMDPLKLGRYSFIGFDPEITFKSKDGNVEIEENGIVKTYEANPFDELKRLMKLYESNCDCVLPFIGGAVGYLGYDMCHHVEDLPRTAVDDVHIPDCFFGIYDGVIAIDHLNKEVYAASPGLFSDAKAWVEAAEEVIKNGKPELPHFEMNNAGEKVKLQSNFEKEDYKEAINKIKDYIRSGDIYQANMTQRFECETKYSPYELYFRLRTINPAPFACYMDFGSGHIVSSSPERFIQIRDGRVETRPIKGTRPRGNTPAEDEANKNELLGSEKDKSELLMIVDLERNDLGRVCKTGSVKVTELFHLEEYPTVYHLVSTVVGELDGDVHTVDCIKAAFPGGSITGAPKIRSMQVIDELEPTQRNIYTGSIGYIGFNGDADLNIVIRTIVQKGDRAFFQVGGGIVWDSDAQMEYEETLHKARALINALDAQV